MIPDMKPIRTKYHGVEFKSRFESEVAMLLDKMGWSWEYEPESFLLPSGHYMPDFRAIDYADQVHYVEVRGYDGRAWQWKEFALELSPPTRYAVFFSDDIFSARWAGGNQHFRMCDMAVIEDVGEHTAERCVFWVPETSRGGAAAVASGALKLATRRGRVMVNSLPVSEWRPARGRR